MGLTFEVIVRDVDEVVPEGLTPAEVAAQLAVTKSAAYTDLAQDHIVITADTLVALKGQILNKPRDRAEAVRMLQALSGKVNQVISAVCLQYQERMEVFHVVTKVQFRELEQEEIDYYVDEYKPFDKAGAYGIQEWIGMIGIEGIEGDYYNVVGLPVPKLWEVLKGF